MKKNIVILLAVMGVIAICSIIIAGTGLEDTDIDPASGEQADIHQPRSAGPTDTTGSWERLTRDAVLALKEGNAEEAKKLCYLAMEQVNKPGKEDLRTVKTHILFGQIYRWEKNYHMAERSFKDAIEVSERTTGPEHMDMVIPLESLANLYYYTLINLEKVAELYRRILAIVEINVSPNDFQVAMRSSNLALVYQKLQQYKKAESYFIKALAVSESGEQFTEKDMAQYLYLYADFYKVWGKCREAEQYALRLLKIRENNQEDHVDARLNLANSLDVLGGIYLSCNEPEKAGKLYRRSLGIIEKAMGKEEAHPDKAIHLTGLAEALKQQGKYDDANVHYQKALETAKEFMGAETPEVAGILEKYAESLRKAGNETESEKAIRNAEEIRNKTGTAE